MNTYFLSSKRHIGFFFTVQKVTEAKIVQKICRIPTKAHGSYFHNVNG